MDSVTVSIADVKKGTLREILFVNFKEIFVSVGKTFEYFGNSKKDLPIWQYCKKIIYTNASANLKEIINASKLDKIEVKEDFY